MEHRTIKLDYKTKNIPTCQYTKAAEMQIFFFSWSREVSDPIKTNQTIISYVNPTQHFPEINYISY